MKVTPALLLAIALCTSTLADEGWPHFGGGQHGQQFSSLTQIDKANVGQLEEAWRFRTGEPAAGFQDKFAFQANPILAEGRLYLPSGNAVVFALNPATGQQIWRYDPQLARDKWYDESGNRGVSSWIDPQAAADSICRHRIFVGTLDARLIALDGTTGKPCPDFGDDGTVRLDVGVGASPDDDSIHYTITSPPVIVGDTLITGSAIGDNRAADSELGIVRGIDARTGTERWRWDPIPRTAEQAVLQGWQPEQAARTGSANAWAPLAADVELGLVYVPTGSASPDFFGGERLGDNLYANSLVALDAATGSVRWYQQLIHHDVWDYDLAAQPTLVELRRGDELIPAVLQGTKTGMIFTFDRRDGTPLFAIEERPVPQGGVAGEQLSPTQPFPVAPPPLVRHDAITEDDAWGMLWFDTRSCRKRIARLRSEGIFTPPSLEGTLLFPGYAGGINWGGIAFEPASQFAVALTLNLAMEVALIPRDALQREYESGDYDDYEFARQRGTPYGMRRSTFVSGLDIPCVKPPWGELTAVDMQTGRIAWQRKVGTLQDVAPGPVPNLELGMPGMGGPIVTAGGLVFMAAVMDHYLRAFDLANGDILWQVRLPVGGQATPMSYFLDTTGKQYVVIAAGGHPNMGDKLGDYVIAYALPNK
ncbi:MAG: pyrroloquinoline quinone-dependent dehydrogenase [Woeseia sp.]